MRLSNDEIFSFNPPGGHFLGLLFAAQRSVRINCQPNDKNVLCMRWLCANISRRDDDVNRKYERRTGSAKVALYMLSSICMQIRSICNFNLENYVCCTFPPCPICICAGGVRAALGRSACVNKKPKAPARNVRVIIFHWEADKRINLMKINAT